MTSRESLIPKLLGFQIVHYDTDSSPRGMTDRQVYPFFWAMAWIRNSYHRHEWRLLPIFDGDIEEPTFPQGTVAF